MLLLSVSEEMTLLVLADLLVPPAHIFFSNHLIVTSSDNDLLDL